MARPASLKKYTRGKYTYWGTQAGGKKVYFGRADELTKRDANVMFCQFIALLHDGVPAKTALQQVKGVREPASARAVVIPYLDELDNAEELRAILEKRPQLAEYNVWKLAEEYLEDCDQRLSENRMKVIPSWLNQFCQHRVTCGLPGANEQIGDLHPLVITAQHLNDFTCVQRGRPRCCPSCNSVAGDKECKKCRGKNQGAPISEQSLLGQQRVVKACWNWAAGKGGHANILPKGFTPLAEVENVKPPAKDTNEDNLPSPDEYDALLDHADHVHAGFDRVIRFAYLAGTRPGEVSAMRVRDVSWNKHTITLTHHKTVKGQRVTSVREVSLGEGDLFALVKECCMGKKGDDLLVCQQNGAPWNKDRVCRVFRGVRAAAGVREHITMYSFRDLWITEMLQFTTLSLLDVAKMAGTSVEMIERHYGHVRNETKQGGLRQLEAARRKARLKAIA